MGKSIIVIVCLLIISCSFAVSQEVVITDFPLGVGGSVDSGFFESYYSQLEILADTLEKYPLAIAVVTGGADGVRFKENHDSQNPGLAVGRAHILRNILVDKFNVNPDRIVIQSSDVAEKGGPQRYAGVRIVRDMESLNARVDTLSQSILDEKWQAIRVGLRFGLGFSSSPFGGIPVLTGAVTWRRIVFAE